jgi:hypothetical protein
MHPFVSAALAEMRIQELHREAATRRLARFTHSRRRRPGMESTRMSPVRLERPCTES